MTKYRALTLRVELAEVRPTVWREIIVSEQATLHELHRIIQLMFLWQDYHLYQFEVSGRRFEAPDVESNAEDASRTRLASFALELGSTLEYIYDFGDHWRHELTVLHAEPVTPDAALPTVLAGERCGPPEDCGGAHRYMQLLQGLASPLEDLEDEDRELVEWVGVDFDPDEFSLSQANHAVSLCAAWDVLKRRR